MDRVLPGADALASRHPERTVFTRFVPPARPNEMPGMWQRYYTRWRVATRERLDFRLLDLMPPLAALCPLATVIDKTRYSAFAEPGLIEHLRQREADALIVSGSETDVCVLATVLDAVDIGYRVIVVRDAICSSSDEGHEPPRVFRRLFRLKSRRHGGLLCHGIVAFLGFGWRDVADGLQQPAIVEPVHPLQRRELDSLE